MTLVFSGCLHIPTHKNKSKPDVEFLLHGSLKCEKDRGSISGG